MFITTVTPRVNFIVQHYKEDVVDITNAISDKYSKRRFHTPLSQKERRDTIQGGYGSLVRWIPYKVKPNRLVVVVVVAVAVEVAIVTGVGLTMNLVRMAMLLHFHAEAVVNC
jgi:hypothetical protein